MSDAPQSGDAPPPQWVRVQDATTPSGYSRSYIVRLLKSASSGVAGRLVTTTLGQYWEVELGSLLRYAAQTHKTGPKGPLGSRKHLAPGGRPAGAAHPKAPA